MSVPTQSYLEKREIRSLALLLLTLTLLKALNLTQLWSYKAGGTIEGLAFADNGNLGVASIDHCAYFFDPEGNLLNRICGNDYMMGIAYCCNYFASVNYDGYVYITDVRGNLIRKIYVGENYDRSITLLKDGFMVCKYRCAFFNNSGSKILDVDVGWVDIGPLYYSNNWYIADRDWNELTIPDTYGSKVNEIYYGERAFGVDVCGRYLAVSTRSHLHLYDISNLIHPRELWKVEGFHTAWQVSFSPNCKYVAVADARNDCLKIYDIHGNLKLRKCYDSIEWTVIWWMDRIAVGLRDGRIYVYKVEGYKLFGGLKPYLWSFLNEKEKQAYLKCYRQLKDPSACYLKVIKLSKAQWDSLNDNQKKLFAKCYKALNDSKYCFTMVKNEKDVLSFIFNLPCKQMAPYALNMLYMSKITCPPGNATDVIKALASKYCSQFNSIHLPTIKAKVTPKQLKQMFLKCISKANKPITEVLSYCVNQVAKKAAKINKEHAYTYAGYL